MSFLDPRGQEIQQGRPHGLSNWKSSRNRLPAALVERLLAENRIQGVEPDACTAGARWRRERDIPDEVFFKATGAV